MRDNVGTTATLGHGTAEPNAARGYGFMYQCSFDDPDGHTREIFHMDESFVQKRSRPLEARTSR